MKRIINLCLWAVLVLCAASAKATTYYVNGVGGTRFSTNVPSGQCNGTSPAAYPGSGTNQNCAFKDIRNLWTDGTYSSSTNNFPAWGWIGVGGDEYLIDCTGGALCHVGQNGPGVNDYYGLAGDQFDAGAPPPPSGTSDAHTKIYGINYASCNGTNKTTVVGGYAISSFINFSGSSYIDVSCFESTDHESCQIGISNAVTPCSGNPPISDYQKTCFQLSNTTTHLLLEHIWCHGSANTGILGAPGDGVTLLDVVVTGNPSSGWNMDPGDGTTGQGTTQLLQVVIYGNGCSEKYPLIGIVTMPWGQMGGMTDCADDQSGGYGDGVGTTTTPSLAPWHIIVDQSTFACNTQDGLDLLHVTGTGNTILVTRSKFYCNMGQQLKIGAPGGTIARNNLFVGNCNALAQTSPAPPGFLPGYNTKPAVSGGAAFGDFCRSSSETVAVTVSDVASTAIQNNTMISADYVGYLIANPLSPLTCTTACQLLFQNNIGVFYQNSIGTPPGNGNATGSVFFDTSIPGTLFANVGSSNDHNATFGGKDPCPNTSQNETNAFCSPPDIVDTTFHQVDIGSMQPSSASSNILGKGLTISGLTTDFNGNPRPSPPAIGAFEFATSATLNTITVTPNPASMLVGGTANMSAACAYSDGSTSPCVVTWSDTAVHSSVGSTTGVVTGLSVGSDTITATISTVSGTATITISAPSFILMQGVKVLGRIN